MWLPPPFPIAIEGVHWTRDGLKFACKVGGCDASYTATYNLVWHLWAHHNVTMELGTPRCPFIQEQVPRVQDHTIMNACVFNNLLAWFRHNEQKDIVKVKRHAFLEWDRLQVDLQYTPKLLKLALVKLVSNHIPRLFGMTTSGCGGHASQCINQAKAWWRSYSCDSSDLSRVCKGTQKAFGWNAIGSLHQIK
jgi:hypothetical protein